MCWSCNSLFLFLAYEGNQAGTYMKKHLPDSTGGKMILDLDLNSLPVECHLLEGTSAAFDPYHTAGQQQESSAQPTSIIDVEEIEDEDLAPSSSGGFTVVIPSWLIIHMFLREPCLARIVIAFSSWLLSNFLYCGRIPWLNKTVARYVKHKSYETYLCRIIYCVKPSYVTMVFITTHCFEFLSSSISTLSCLVPYFLISTCSKA